MTETSEIPFTVEITSSRSWVWLTLNSTLCVPSVGWLGALEGCMGLWVQIPRKCRKWEFLCVFKLKKMKYYGQNVRNEFLKIHSQMLI